MIQTANFARKYQKLILTVFLSLIITSSALILFGGGILSAWSLDWLWSIIGPLKTSNEESVIGKQVVIIGVDEKTLFKLRGDKSRLSREVYARLIQKLSEMGARRIGLDITFDEAGNELEDKALFDSAKKADRVVTNCYLANSEDFTKIWISGRSFFRKVAKAEGFADFPLDFDRDHFIRRVRLYYPRGELPCRIAFSVALYLSDIGARPEDAVYDGSAVELPAPISSERIRIPLDYRGLALVGFLGGAGSLETFSALDLLEDRIPIEKIRDKIALIGGTAAELRDSFHTPFARKGEMPGVELHGHLLECLLAGKFIREITGPYWWLSLILMTVTFSLITVYTSPLKGAIFSISFSFLQFPLVPYMFASQGIFINPFDIWGCVALSWISAILSNDIILRREKSTITKLFRQYVSPNLLRELLENPESIALGGAKREAVVLFADIRGFTSVCEERPPEEVINLLNKYFNIVSQKIFENGGVVDKYIGDGMMAFFGIPIYHGNEAENSVRSAIQMLSELRKFNAGIDGKEEFSFKNIGIGIHGGVVVVGNVGSDKHQEYTILGDTVNVASRLEALSQKDEILISSWIKERLPEGKFKLKSMGDVKVKGRKSHVHGYQVLGENINTNIT
ncbi:MAG: adenylate/guanylate cyclase domain-containing protein [Candidatus Riflebacteria bacterium]|nr:adenylate/guanylate cyclase domain-containing protein [Candidatus Riflebacteria bacterium]